MAVEVLPPIAASQRKRRRRRRRQPSIPRTLREEVVRHTRAIARKYKDLFDADHELKSKVLRLARALLPPRPKRRGRPRDPQITGAIKLHGKLRRQYPSEKPRQIWYRVAGEMISDFASYNELERRSLVSDLRQRVKSRLRKRPLRKPRRISRSLTPFQFMSQ